MSQQISGGLAAAVVVEEKEDTDSSERIRVPREPRVRTYPQVAASVQEEEVAEVGAFEDVDEDEDEDEGASNIYLNPVASTSTAAFAAASTVHRRPSPMMSSRAIKENTEEEEDEEEEEMSDVNFSRDDDDDDDDDFLSHDGIDIREEDRLLFVEALPKIKNLADRLRFLEGSKGKDFTRGGRVCLSKAILDAVHPKLSGFEVYAKYFHPFTMTAADTNLSCLKRRRKMGARMRASMYGSQPNVDPSFFNFRNHGDLNRLGKIVNASILIYFAKAGDGFEFLETFHDFRTVSAKPLGLFPLPSSGTVVAESELPATATAPTLLCFVVTAKGELFRMPAGPIDAALTPRPFHIQGESSMATDMCIAKAIAILLGFRPPPAELRCRTGAELREKSDALFQFWRKPPSFLVVSYSRNLLAKCVPSKLHRRKGYSQCYYSTVAFIGGDDKILAEERRTDEEGEEEESKRSRLSEQQSSSVKNATRVVTILLKQQQQEKNAKDSRIICVYANNRVGRVCDSHRPALLERYKQICKWDTPEEGSATDGYKKIPHVSLEQQRDALAIHRAKAREKVAARRRKERDELTVEVEQQNQRERELEEEVDDPSVMPRQSPPPPPPPPRNVSAGVRICHCRICDSKEYENNMAVSGPERMCVIPLDARDLLEMLGLDTPENLSILDQLSSLSIASMDIESKTTKVDLEPPETVLHYEHIDTSALGGHTKKVQKPIMIGHLDNLLRIDTGELLDDTTDVPAMTEAKYATVYVPAFTARSDSERSIYKMFEKYWQHVLGRRDAIVALKKIIAAPLLEIIQQYSRAHVAFCMYWHNNKKPFKDLATIGHSFRGSVPGKLQSAISRLISSYNIFSFYG